MTDLRSIPGAGIDDVRAADEKCARLARTHYENFPVLGPLLLPSERRDLAAIYAFCRTTDDLGDEAEGDRVPLLQTWRQLVQDALAGDPTPDAPILSALARTARSRAIDPELFFPVGNSGPALLQIAEAKTVCRRCPVVSDCLAWALESGQDAGVWGGMSEDERRALKRRNARTRARSNA